MVRLTLALCITASVLLTGCIKIPNEYSVVPPGTWRATLNLSAQASDDTFDEKAKGQLPFNFEIVYDTQDSFHIEVINGEERIVVDQIVYGRDITSGRDTIRIDFPVYDTYILAAYEEDAIEGDWYVTNRGNYSIPFRAYHGKNQRFDIGVNKPDIEVSGRWKAEFSPGTDSQYPAVAYFNQEGDKVTGTFLTETGDYRFLEGNVANDRLYLSVFDGAHAFLFEAKLLEDGSLAGIFRSGKHYKTYWTATRNDTFELQDPNTLTYLNEGFDAFDFTAETVDGQTVSLSDERFAGKPKLVQILGTWCPNCRDETRFLVDYLKENPQPDLEILALAFERHKEKDKALSAIRTYIEYFDIPYEMLYAGPSDKAEASELLPAINRVISYPTLIFIDRQNRVRKIHTGFSGPATNKYAAFVEEFAAAVAELTEPAI